MHYIKDVSAPPTAHNLHFYQLKKRKADPLGTAWLGICPKGVEIYEVSDRETLNHDLIGGSFYRDCFVACI